MFSGLTRTLGQLLPALVGSRPRQPEVPAEEETVMHSPCL